MNTGTMIGLAVLAYLFIRNYGSGGGDLFGNLFSGATPVPAPQPSAPTGAAANPTTLALNTLQSDPVALAQALLHVAATNGFPGNPTLTYDQWNWMVTERLSPLLTPPDFSSVAPRDAGGGTPAVVALKYAQDYVQLHAHPAGVSGLAGLGRTGDIVDLRRTQTSKWTM